MGSWLSRSARLTPLKVNSRAGLKPAHVNSSAAQYITRPSTLTTD